jgi:hypothetical protein
MGFHYLGKETSFSADMKHGSGYVYQKYSIIYPFSCINRADWLREIRLVPGVFHDSAAAAETHLR